MTGRIDKLRRVYGKLSPLERVALFLAAQERDDWRELDALDDTCPTADLSFYVTYLLGLQHCAGLVAVQLLARAVLLVAGLGAPDGDPALDALLHETATLWRAFAAWCRGMEHDPRQVLSLAPLGRDEADPARFVLDLLIERCESWSADVPRDPDQERRWRRLFRGPLCG